MTAETKTLYRVQFKKRNGEVVYTGVRVSCIDSLYAAICGMANISSTTELESLEIHRVKEDNTVEIIQHKYDDPSKVESSWCGLSSCSPSKAFKVVQA